MNRILLHKKDRVRIQNNFEIPQPQKIESQNKNYFIDDEGYLHWSPKGGNEVKRAKEIWQKAKHTDQTRQLATALEKGSLTKQQTKAIVLHRTDTDTSLQAINGFLRGVGTHFLIDKDGIIYQCASLYKWTQHVGDIRSKTELEKTWDAKEKVLIENIWKEKTSYSTRKIKVSNYEKAKSYPNRYPINSDSIGIEVVGKYDNKAERYPNATTKQLESLEQLVLILLGLFNINKTDIYAHAKIAYKDKNSTEGVSLLEYIKERL